MSACEDLCAPGRTGHPHVTLLGGLLGVVVGVYELISVVSLKLLEWIHDLYPIPTLSTLRACQQPGRLQAKKGALLAPRKKNGEER